METETRLPEGLEVHTFQSLLPMPPLLIDVELPMSRTSSGIAVSRHPLRGIDRAVMDDDMWWEACKQLALKEFREGCIEHHGADWLPTEGRWLIVHSHDRESAWGGTVIVTELYHESETIT